MRTYGRVTVGGVQRWVQVNTDAAGQNDEVYITALAQVLKLNLGESPFWANYGIPAQQSVMTQVFPDFYVARVQQQFSGYFALLRINRVQGTAVPTYDVNIVTKRGAILTAQVAL